MPIYACYVRVSSDEQRERQSIQSQIEALNTYARANKIKLRHVFADDGVSGTIPVGGRAEGSRLLTMAAQQSFDTLLVFRIDRLSRDTLELLRTIKELEQSGVAVKSITEPFETTSSVGKFTLTMLGGLAQMERDAIKDRSGAGMRRGAGEGRWMGGRAPFGYRIAGNRLAINEAEAAIIREIFEHYLSGVNTIEIAKMLNARRVPTPEAFRHPEKQTKWIDSTVSKLLNREAYKGIFRWNRRKGLKNEGRRAGTVPTNESEQIAFEVEPIISPEDYDKVQKRLKDNLKFSTRNARREYVLRGLVVCGECGLVCTGAGGTEYPYYACNWRRIKDTRCKRPRILAVSLEERVWKDLVEIARHPETLLSTLRRRHETSHNQKSNRKREMELLTLISGKAGERGKVLELLRRDSISVDESDEQLRIIEQERAALENELYRLRDSLRSVEQLNRSLSNIETALKEIKRGAGRATPSERAELIRRAVSRVIVSAPDAGETELNMEIEYLLSETP